MRLIELLLKHGQSCRIDGFGKIKIDVNIDSQLGKALWESSDVRITCVLDDHVSLAYTGGLPDTAQQSPQYTEEQLHGMLVRHRTGKYRLHRVGYRHYQALAGKSRLWKEPRSFDEVQLAFKHGWLAPDKTSSPLPGEELAHTYTCYDLHGESIDDAEPGRDKPAKSLTARVRLAKDKSSVLIGVAGCGLAAMPTGFDEVICLETYEGENRLLVWADVNNEEPTHLISLAGAEESQRRDD